MFDIAITLVNTKERKDIEHSLETLFADSNGSGLSLAVVIVDNASNDGIEELKDNDFIIERGYKGEIFEVTSLGFQIADSI